MKKHHYNTELIWTGNNGKGTLNYQSYGRAYTISIKNKPDLSGSSDPAFRGDNSKHNPEELLLASLSSCHMLWYLHLCSSEGIIVQEYSDHATGTMVESADGSGKFTEVILKPSVVISDNKKIIRANELHHKANEMCFIANSVNFPVHHHPTCTTMSAEKKEEVQIIEYLPKYRNRWKEINVEWVTETFWMEEVDHQHCNEPEKYILEKGGNILLAKLGGEIVGTAGLLLEENGVFELIKMAVDKRYRGRGIGRKLCTAAIEKAKSEKAKMLYLLSNTKGVGDAVSLYRKLGFKEVPLSSDEFERANIQMELWF